MSRAHTPTRAGRLYALFFALACASIASCGERPDAGGGATPEAGEAQPRYGGTAVVGWPGDVANVNPLTGSDALSIMITRNVLFMPLVQFDASLNVVPYLARSWDLNEDTTELTFHLRQDVYWHDGVKTTAHDVKFSYDRMRDPETAFSAPNLFTHYGEAEAPDSFTFRVRMRPHADYMVAWLVPPAPRHLLQHVPPAQLAQHPFGSTRPVGNGPFRFVSRSIGENWIFAANERFPAELGGRPYLDRLVLRNIPEQTTLLTELKTGGVDLHPGASPEDLEHAPASRETRRLPYNTPSREYIAWNQRRPLFRDARVRRALTMAIDRQAIVDGLLYGYAEVALSPVPPSFWNHDSAAGADLKYDPGAAKRLLAEAGWQDRDGDGIVENRNGTPFRFTLLTSKEGETRTDVAEVVQADLKRVGIDVQVQLGEWNTLLARADDPTRRDFDAILLGSGTSSLRVDQTDEFHCDRRKGRRQHTGTCDPAIDRLLDTLPTIIDRKAALPLWRQYQRVLSTHQPVTLLFYPRRVALARNRLQNVRPDVRGAWVGVRDWWIDPDQK